MYQQRILSLLETPHLDAEKDIGSIAQCARLETLLAAVYEYLAKRIKAGGLFDADGNPEPVVRTLLAAENSLGRTYDRLLLSPQSRRVMKVRGGKSIAIELSEDEDEGQ